MLTYLQLTQRLHSETIRSTAAPTTIVNCTDRNQRLFNWIADAWRDIQQERDWKWMRQTLNAPLILGQQLYNPTTDLGCVNFGRWRPEDRDYSVYVYIAGSNNSPFKVDQWDLDEFRYHFVYRSVGESVPFAWTADEQQNLLLGPIPAANYYLRQEYWQEPTELVNDDDTPNLPNRFALLIMWKALLDSGQADAAPETIARAQQHYAVLHSQMLMDQSHQPHL